MKFASMRDIVYFLDELIAHPPEKHDRLAYVAHILEILGSPQSKFPPSTSLALYCRQLIIYNIM
ncbi:hypothetical protein GWK74_00270 [Candidatus Saccharibacteria bacterium oral taxon 488]|nr:hypothetical protein GWK74_00270 [Candidatus Saccharibacteria bacterium oral taxon 488]